MLRLLLLLAVIASAAADEARVRALFTAHCLRCHGDDDLKGGLDLRTREALLRGGDSGPAVVPGDPARSWLYRLVSHQADPRMPHKKAKLGEADIAAIAAWIAGGAPYSEADR